MASGIVSTAAEYLVKLGVQLDYGNMDKMEKFLDSSAMKAASLGAAMLAGVTAIYKFMKSMTAMEMEFVNLAREQNKSVNAVRAQETALKAMGKTAKEVERDPALRNIKKHLEEIGKAMRLPDMSRSLKTVRALQQEFYGLKMTLQYALQWLNHYLLMDLRSTIERLTAWFQKIRTWVQTRMQPFTRKLATFLGDFVRGVEGIFRIVDKIMGVIDRLPDSVKSFGAAFAGVYAFLKSGPLGQILILLTAIGDLIKDFENYQFARAKGVSREMADTLFNNQNGYIGPDGRLTETGKAYLNENGVDSSGIVGVAFSQLWGPVSEGDWGGAVKTAFQPLLDGLNQVFTVDIPALLNGETSILDLVFRILNGTTVEEASSRLSGFGSAVTGGMIAAIGTYLTLDVLAPITDSLLGENAFAAFGVLFGSKILGSVADAFANLSFEPGEGGEGTWSDPIVQTISDLLQSVFSIDLAQVMKDMDILTDEGEVTEKAKGMAEKVASWGSVIGRVISSSLNSNTNWFTLAIDGSTLVSAISNALQSQETELTSDETSEIVSAASGVLSSVTGLLGMPLLQALFAIGSDTTTRRDFLSLFLGEFLGASDDSAVKDAAYDILGDKYAGGGLWDTLMDILLGAPEGGYKHYDAATGEEIADDMLEGFQGTIVTKMASERPERGGVWGSLLNWLLGHDETGEDGVTRHVNGVFETLWDGIRDGAMSLGDDLVTILSGAFDRLWSDILAKMPQWAKDLLGIEDVTTVTFDEENGKVTIASTNGSSVDLNAGPNEEGITYEDVLSAYGIPTDKLQGNTRILGFGFGDYLSIPGFGDWQTGLNLPNAQAAFDRAKTTASGAIVQALNSGNTHLAQYLIETILEFVNGKRPARDFLSWVKDGMSEAPEGWTPKTQVVPSGQPAGGQPADIPVDGEVKFDKTQMQNAADSVGPVSIEADADFSSSGGSGGVGSGANGSTNATNEYHAWGGRIDSDTVTHVGEDGPEYIIPISKPRRAMDLIMRMFHEVGGNVLRQVVEGFGLNGGADTIGGSLSTLGVPQSSISITNNVNVTNTIYVQGGDRSASEIGYAAYDASERYLLRTLQGVLS